MSAIAKREAQYILGPWMIACLAIAAALVLAFLYWLHFRKVRGLKKEITDLEAKGKVVSDQKSEKDVFYRSKNGMSLYHGHSSK